MKKSLTKRERIRKRTDLRRVFTSFKRQECRGLKLLYSDNNLQWNRIAFSPVRKFGRAIDRNREKRVFREIYRTAKQQINIGYDLVFVIYPGEYSFVDRMNQVSSLLERAGLKE